MSWNLKNIPKIAHFYWDSATGMSFLRYLTIYSFRKYNPDWKIKIHSSVETYKNNVTWCTSEHKNGVVTGTYDNECRNIKNVEFIKHDFTKYNFTNNVPEVYKSDFLRWILLYQQGGLWSDFDILYTAPMDNLNFNNEANQNLDTGVCMYPSNIHSIGFLLSSMENTLFKKVHQLALRYFNPSNYQSIGSNILNAEFMGMQRIKDTTPNCSPINIPMDVVYKINAYNIQDFWITSSEPWNDPNVIGLHWYAGHPMSQEWDSKITKDNYKDFNNTICIGIKKVL